MTPRPAFQKTIRSPAGPGGTECRAPAETWNQIAESSANPPASPASRQQRRRSQIRAAAPASPADTASGVM